MSNHAHAQQNRKKNANNASGYKNIRRNKSGSWVIEVGGVYLGSRRTLPEAVKLRNEYRKRCFTATKGE